jgi:hypothetical protein
VTASPRTARMGSMKWRLMSAAMVAAVLTLFAGANAHLVYVAVKSQPGCVPHEGISDDAGMTTGFRAAKSAC